MAHLARIRVYPVKALDPLELPAADLLASGALRLDRAFALVDSEGRFVNGKRVPAVHGLRARFSAEGPAVTLEAPQRPELGSVSAWLENEGAECAALLEWLAAYFGFPVRLRRDAERGFPDDTETPGPTLVSTASLEAVASWYPGLSVESLRLRFRANLEIDGVPAFWEDRLFGTQKGVDDVPFTIGSARFWGRNPCQRCIVPTREAHGGEPWPGFQKIFMEQRKATLPDWTVAERFNHFYRLTLNTRAEAGRVSVGDAVSGPLP